MDCTKNELLKQIMAIDFRITDLHLYLNTHPCDYAALMQHNQAVINSRMLTDRYERMYGPLVMSRTIATVPWPWINNPWPWQKDANFTLDGKEGC